MEPRTIRKLPDEIIGKIAAGEVVESPAAAIKELVENSIDAGAKNVTIEIRDGGISYLRVTDNGSGIRREDVRMAFERHATSKISKADDLFQLSSLGFRGEALASIAAVSKVTLTTRTHDDERGTRVICQGGVIEEIVEAASPEGTTFVARDLFYNTPVRLKFLKKPATEAARVCDMVLRIIVSHPDIAFRLISNEKQVYMSPGNGDMRSVAFCLYGREIAAALTEVKGGGSIGVHGLVGVGPLARANRTHQTFIINGRYVKSALLTQALEDACRERTTVGHYPICLLHVDMSGSMVDVNVHPNKLEVRFSDENLVYQNVKGILSDSFSNAPLEGIPSVTLTDKKTQDVSPAPVRVDAAPIGPQESLKKTPQDKKTDTAQEQRACAEKDTLKTAPAAVQEAPQSSFGNFVSRYFSEPAPRAVLHEKEKSLTKKPPIVFAPYPDDDPQAVASRTKRDSQEAAQKASSQADRHTDKKDPLPSEPAQQEIALEEAARGNAIARSEKTDAKAGDTFPFKILGVLFDTYILLEQRDRLLLVDQHAAHERVLYERMMKSIDIGAATQELLVSQVVRVTPQEKERLDTYSEEIAQAGFDIEPFGDEAVRIRAVPLVLGVPQVRETFVELLDQLGQMRVLNTREKRREAILQMACKHAVKGGDKLSAEEIVRLLSDVLSSDAPPTCPHGRPLVVSLPRTEIEKRFKRINH